MTTACSFSPDWGGPWELTDAELLCLAFAQVLVGIPSAHDWIRFAHARLGRLFRASPERVRNLRQ
ncbi:hypothetical protein [Streptomyces sp. PSAA01]|uniref:hypothetical protein n=1 Tax=Streptomyces sp. PSAA01 TaxID=2912762 RepID=UPI001F3328B2|nr:hypothetical protein [Streptomyces sp. PSAA01]MCG0289006.1 hypothetical protein [Streptomyces sp. PSAA01]